MSLAASSNYDGTQIANKLANFLKLPKAQRWVCCEWFYSDIDKAIFEAENDFSLCLKQSFPRLKTRKLRRKQWCIIKSLIGKPRRCSDAFFQEERQMLEDKRQKIRLVQQRKVTEKEFNDFRDLPQEIPLMLSIGHRVYCHVSRPEEGVFLGTIAAVDPCEHTYRVVFDRPALGSLTVNDYDIKSMLPVETIPIRAYVQTFRPKQQQQTPSYVYSSNLSNKSAATAAALAAIGGLTSTGNMSNLLTPNPSMLLDDLSVNNPEALAAALMLHSHRMDPMLGITNSPFKFSDGNVSFGDIFSQHPTPLNVANNIVTSYSQLNGTNLNSGLLGGFPVRLLLMITRLTKILNVKKDFIAKLSALNTEAEHLRATGQAFSRDFQMNYAMLVLDLEKLNKDLSEYLLGIQKYCEEFAPDYKIHLPANLTAPSAASAAAAPVVVEPEAKADVKATAATPASEAAELVKKYNGAARIRSRHLTQLITKMIMLMVQMRNYASSTTKTQHKQHSGGDSADEQAFCTRALNESLAEIKQALLSPTNAKIFEDKVQVHTNHVQSSLSAYSKLHAFKYVNYPFVTRQQQPQHQPPTMTNSATIMTNQIMPNNNGVSTDEDDDLDDFDDDDDDDEEDMDLDDQEMNQDEDEEYNNDENLEGDDDDYVVTAKNKTNGGLMVNSKKHPFTATSESVLNTSNSFAKNASTLTAPVTTRLAQKMLVATNATAADKIISINGQT